MIKKVVLIALIFMVANSVGCKKSPTTPKNEEEEIRPTIQSFTANPAAVRSGEVTTLSWKTSNAETCTIWPAGWSVSPSGSRNVYPEETTIYELRAENDYGHASAQCTVMVYRAAELTMTFSPAGPVFDFYPDETCKSTFTVILTETNGVGGRIDTIRVIGTPKTGSSYAQAFEGGTFTANGSFSRLCNVHLFCWPEHVLVKAEGVDMHGYTIDVRASFLLIWSQGQVVVQSIEVSYGRPSHGRKIGKD